MKSLYELHLSVLTRRTEQALAQCEYDYVIIASGQSSLRFLDDYRVPFKCNPHFSQWVPLQDKQNCWLLVRQGVQPKLFYHQPQDFWHLIESLPSAEWTKLLDIEVFDDKKQLNAGLNHLDGRGALIGPPMENKNLWGCEQNPIALLNYLHYSRAYKTEWEQQNLREANHIAVKGHHAASVAFDEGRSEYEIHQAYLSATQQCETNLPYGNIVGLNEHASILHYQYKDLSKPVESRCLLLDAGATHHGYAADITRTFTPKGTLFSDLVDAVDVEQQALISTIRSGIEYIDLHQSMLRRLAGILKTFNLVHLDEEAQLKTSMINTFFPHGLGHLLGLQVHDIGGYQQSVEGDLKMPPANVSPALRLTRMLTEEMVVTIEPGLYFIDTLLATLKASDQRKYVNWALIEQLRPYGGVRIEDNILVTDDGCENFTRDAFSAFVMS